MFRIKKEIFSSRWLFSSPWLAGWLPQFAIFMENGEKILWEK